MINESTELYQKMRGLINGHDTTDQASSLLTLYIQVCYENCSKDMCLKCVSLAWDFIERSRKNEGN